MQAPIIEAAFALRLLW